jgi:hypothetical protein
MTEKMARTHQNNPNIRNSISVIILAVLILFSCKKEDNQIENTPQNNFQVLWEDFNTNYPAFQLNNINWDSIYTVNFAIIDSNTTDYDLFNILNSSILTLKDAHSDIISNQFGSTNFYDIFVRQKPANYPDCDAIFSKYVKLTKFNHANATLGYGKVINQDIGYFLIESFNEDKRDYDLIDSFLEDFQNSKAIIIDIRNNGGGDEAYAQIIASRLTNQAVIYRYYRKRNGEKYSDLGDFQSLTLHPRGKLKFTKPVILITNRHTFSAAEDFTLMLRSLPNVVHLGDTTFGGVATHPVIKTLPNGWTYRMATTLIYDRNKVPIKGGIAPHFAVQISKTDSINGVDRIIEEAIIKINER